MDFRIFAYWSNALAVVAMSNVLLPAHGSEAGSCPVTLPKDWPTRPAPGNSSAFGWYGSSNLAAYLPSDGVWYGMGPKRNYGDKFWWWREGYSAHQEPVPDLSISALRLDAPAPPVHIEQATNALGQRRPDLMLVGMEFPTAGCWEIRGTYRGSQELTAVVFVRSKEE